MIYILYLSLALVWMSYKYWRLLYSIEKAALEGLPEAILPESGLWPDRKRNTRLVSGHKWKLEIVAGYGIYETELATVTEVMDHLIEKWRIEDGVHVETYIVSEPTGEIPTNRLIPSWISIE